MAIVGSGPSGFYAAALLLGRDGADVQVDMFDRLPTPWGLVRGGVAPDHPNIKAVSRVYEKTAAHPEFRFFGNVEVGRHLLHQDLTRRYHAVIYAVGAQTDKRMGIPGEDLPGSWAATEFVAWYNGHPDYRDLEFDLSGERAVVVGNGNVAADVARMLALPRDELATTDVADHALEALAESNIREIVVLGRRGPAQAAFTNPELLELGRMTDADVRVDAADVDLDPISRAWLASDKAGLTTRRNMEILTEYSQRTPGAKRRRVALRFLLSPQELTGHGRVEALEIRRNRLVEAADGGVAAQPTDETEAIATGLVFRSIGYRGVPLDGLPFDDRRGVVPNQDGRVVEADSGEPLPGVYVVGWIKRGPSGIIGTNKKDAQQTVTALFDDAETGKLLVPDQRERDEVEGLVRERSPHYLSYAGWEEIDRAERARGERLGRPRVKYCTFEGLLAAARPDSEPVQDEPAELSHSRGQAVVTGYLDEQGISYEVVEHPPAYTASEQAGAAGVTLDRAARAVALRDDGGFHVVVLPASDALDLRKARTALGGEPSLRLASDDEIRSALKSPAADVLPPLAPLLRAPEIMDRRLLEHSRILISGGDHRHAVLLDPHDLVEIVQPRIADISRD